ncbi:hypothetical protein KR026_012357 [Drosophila bipectinata]|nr:hypothetical protein KR026_012357 [Drosophila bipectinata]
MSFVVTNQSVIRFGSTKEEDDFERTLMFFNIDISTGGDLSCDHRNEIISARTFDGNRKPRNPGGGSNSRIKESAMSFGQPNKFFAQSQNSLEDFGCSLRQHGKRFSGGKRDSSDFTESRSHFYYHSNKPKKIYRSDKKTSFQQPTRDYNTNINPEDDTNMAGNARNIFSSRIYRAHTDTYNQLALSPSISNHGNYRNCDSRNDYSPEYYSHMKDFPQADSPLESLSSYPNDPLEIDYRRYHGTPLPRRSEILGRRNKHRQISGSMSPEYPSNYNSYLENHDDLEYNRPDYNGARLYIDEYFDDRCAKGHRHEACDQYEYRPDYDYYEERRSPLPIPIQKPKQYRRYRNPSTPCARLREESKRSHKLAKYNKPEISYDGQDSDSKRYDSDEFLNYQIDKTVPEKYFRHFKDAEVPSRRHDRVSREIARLSFPKNYQYNMEPMKRFNRPGIANRTTEKIDWSDKNTARNSICDSLKKYPREYFRHQSRHAQLEEEPRSRNLLGTESVVCPNRPVFPREYDRHKRRKHHKSRTDQKKVVDFGLGPGSYIGTEIPHRIFEKTRTPSSIFFTIEIPYKKKENGNSPPYKSTTRRRDSGCDTIAQESISACELNTEHKKTGSAFKLNAPVKWHKKMEKFVKLRQSFLDMEKHGNRKTIKQKISEFFKRSKISLKRSTILKNKAKVLNSSCKPFQCHLDFAKLSNFVLPKQEQIMSASPNIIEKNAFTSSNRYRKKRVSPRNSNECFLKENETSPFKHNENAFNQYFCKKAGESKYPTLYRGNSKKNTASEEDDNYQEYSMYNFLSARHRCHRNRPKIDKYDQGLSTWREEYMRSRLDKVAFPRVSSGSCSLYSEGKKSEDSHRSQINVCLTIRAEEMSLSGSPRIISSEVIRGSRLSNEDLKIGVSQSPNESLARKESGSNAFQSVWIPTNSCFFRSNSSQSGSSRATNDITPSPERKTIEYCSRPPGRKSPRGRSSDYSNSIRPLRESCHSALNSNRQKCHFKPSRQCLRPRAQSNYNRKSSLNEANKSCEKVVPQKKVYLDKNTSNFLPKISSMLPFSGCQQSKSINASFGGCQSTNAWPGQKPRRCSSAPIKSPIQPRLFSPGTDSPCSQSNVSKDCGYCNRKTTSPENLQLVCMDDPHALRRNCNGSNTSSYTSWPCRDNAATTRGDLCVPKLGHDMEKKSKCQQSIVEELKRELLLSFRQDETLEDQRHCFRPTPFMLLPYVPDSMHQPNGHLTSTSLCGPEPVVCWAPCSNPQAHF